MIGRLLRALALGIGLYVLLTAVHYGTLWGLDQMRQRIEVRLEQRYGADAVDREPPYKPGERWVMAFDIQLASWNEALTVSAVLNLPIAIVIGIAARRLRRLALWLVAAVTNMLALWLMTRLGGLAGVGYLVFNSTAAVVEGAIVGLLQGILGGLILHARDGSQKA